MIAGDTLERVPLGQKRLGCSPVEVDLVEPSRAGRFAADSAGGERQGLHLIRVCCAGPILSAPEPLLMGGPRQLGGSLLLLWPVSKEVLLARNQV